MAFTQRSSRDKFPNSNSRVDSSTKRLLRFRATLKFPYDIARKFLPSSPSSRNRFPWIAKYVRAHARHAFICTAAFTHSARVPRRRRRRLWWIRSLDMQSGSGGVVGDRGAGAAARLYYFSSHVNTTTADGHWIMWRITEARTVVRLSVQREGETEGREI